MTNKINKAFRNNEMELPEGKTCKDCLHCRKCIGMFGVKETNTECDFYPIRFQARLELTD